MTIYGKKPRKLRCLIVLTILILLISLLAGGFAAAANDNDTNDALRSELITVRVNAGDTLWGLVKQHCDTKEDIRKIIYEVEQLNNITNANIYEGQILYLPSK